ncbi:helix-turn-helix domain-containing protein [Flavobacterium phycosphaerae]|uniref:helix-turn-helix domain-containing protein n=1 Tax=Flavobacterium phycosphaerae TaxID=2697515 RepID=UPI001389F2CB|nr:helix-turn-helix transcriptional regulator [Flavobacterium phycosphaerae]
MIRLNITRILKMKGITEPNQFFIERGHSPSYTYDLLRNNLNSLSMKKLEMLCRDLNCTPNDLLTYIPEKGKMVLPDHALHSLTKTETGTEVNQLLHNLPLEKIEELYRVLKGTPESE